MSKHAGQQWAQDARDARQDARWWRAEAQRKEDAGDHAGARRCREHAAKRDAEAAELEKKARRGQ